jgi:hypothetical protein
VLELIGSRPVSGLTPDPIQQMLNNMADADYSYSAAVAEMDAEICQGTAAKRYT